MLNKIFKIFTNSFPSSSNPKVFAGPYLEDPVEREKFSEAYRAMTEGFLAFPLCVPGTAVWKGKQGRIFVIKASERGTSVSSILPFSNVCMCPCYPQRSRVSKLDHSLYVMDGRF